MAHTALTALIEDPAELASVTASIYLAIERSFVTHPMRKFTEAEVKRRFEICIKWFRELKAVPFTTRRTLNEIPIALRAELDHRPYSIPTSVLWSPTGHAL